MSSLSIRQVEETARAFRQQGILHCFTGHVAVNYWGYHRAFSELDILISPNPLSLPRINQALAILGLPNGITDTLLGNPIIRISDGLVFVDLYTQTNDGRFLSREMIRWVSFGSDIIPVMRLEPLLAHLQGAGDQYPEEEYADAIKRIMELLRLEHRPLNPRHFLA